MSWLNALAATATGLLSGWGVGGGSLLMIYMTAVSGIPQLTAAALNLLYFLPTAGSSLVFHARAKHIDWRVFWPAALTGLLTGGVCAWLAHSLNGTLLHKAFGLFLCYIGVTELFRKSK